MSAPVTTDPGVLWRLAVEELRAAGVQRVFGLPGDDMQAAIALRDAGIALVATRAQRTAVLAAAAHARVSGTPGVVVVGRGPGVAGVVPGLLEAATAGASVVVLAGGTPLGRAYQGAFQEAPQLDLVSSLTAHAQRVESASQVAPAVRLALAVAADPRGGPTFVELPDPPAAGDPAWPDASAAQPGPAPVTAAGAPGAPPLPDLLARAERPVVLAGAGAMGAGSDALAAFAAALGAPVVVTASGRGAIRESDPHFLGLAGLYLLPPAVELLAEADLLVALGSRLEETAVEHLPTDLTTVQVNVEPAHHDHARPGLLLTADVGATLAAWTPALGATPGPGAWAARAARARADCAAWTERVCVPGSLPAVLRDLSGGLAELDPDSLVVCHENGQADIWSYLAPILSLPDGARAVVPSEQTTLGTGCAGALGVAHDGRRAVVVTGDGALGTILDELGHPATARLPVLYVVLADGAFGWLETQAEGAGLGRGTFTDHLQASPTRVPVVLLDDPHSAPEAFARALAMLDEGVQIIVVPCTPADRPPVA